MIKFVFSVLTIFLLGNYSCGYQVKDAPLLTKRPSWLKVCRRNDPNLNACLTDLFQEMFPQLARGIPEMNVDPFEPLFLDSVGVSKGSGAITLTGGLFNLTVTGSSNATPPYAELDLVDKKWNFGLNIPLLSIKSNYNLKGKILVLPLVGHGLCDLKLGKVQTDVKTDFQFLTRDNREIIYIDKMHVDFTLEQLKVNFYNLFNGNKILGQTVNNFINQNGLEIVKELSESIGESLAKTFTDIVNNVYTKMPTDLWLLSDEQYQDYLKTINS